jgi:hypothetical protein
MEALLTSDGTATQVWNLAVTSQNQLLAALAEVSNSGDVKSQSLLLILEKSSGAPLINGFVMQHDASAGVKSVQPQAYVTMHWTDSSTLWVVFGTGRSEI